MNPKNFSQLASKLSRPYRVTDGGKFRLNKFNPDDTGTFGKDDKPHAKAALQEGVEILRELEQMLAAQNRWSVLLIFQAMDAAGKDGTIKHVMSGVNPQNCHVVSFKAPSNEELDHDFMWRCLKQLPERGRIGIFNRSYYEETLIVRIHQELLRKQRLPDKLVKKTIWKERFEDIRNIEKYLSRNGVLVRKFFLNVSKEEQKQRFLDRLSIPEKHWKFEEGDVHERSHWDQYMKAYEDTIRNTATKDAPWYVIPADHKWYTRVIVSAAIIDALSSLDLHYPRVSKARREELAEAKRELESEG